MGSRRGVITRLQEKLEANQNSTSGAGATAQIIGITDLLCEGPIAGVVGGPTGVYLNDNPSEPSKFAGFNPIGNPVGTPDEEEVTITFDGTSFVGTIANAFVPADFQIGRNRRLNLRMLHTQVTTSTPVFDTDENSLKITCTAVSGTPFTQDWGTSNTSMDFNILERASGDSWGYAEYVSDTQMVFYPKYTKGEPSDYPAGTYTLSRTKTWPLKEKTLTTFTVEGFQYGGDPPPAGTYKFYVNKQPLVDAPPAPNNRNNGEEGAHLKSLGVSVRTGKLLDQKPFNEIMNAEGGSSSIAGSTSGINLVQLQQLSTTEATNLGIRLYDSAASSYPDGQSSARAANPTIINSSDFGLTTASKIHEADEVFFGIKYNALQTLDIKGGGSESAYARYVIEIQLKRAGAFTGEYQQVYTNYNTEYVEHFADTNAPISFEHRINLDKFRPFEDFKIRVTRVTRHIGMPVTNDGTKAGRTDRKKWSLQAKAVISNLGAIIKDKFEFPGTAMAQITFNSREFNNVPKRSYHLRGKLVRIPTTYTPREYSSSGKALYEEFWGGDFKFGYYTNNPAWVFLDLLTNSRYGAGKWIKDSDIDIYSLYRISKYCDELVEDGTIHNVTQLDPGTYYKIKDDPADTDWEDVGASSGYSIDDVFRCNAEVSSGTGKAYRMEPRFTCNVFITRSTDVYKVAKDLATVFSGILYWMDSQLTPVQDVPQDPVYSFSQSNVIDGAFTYETTGTKTKINQIIVTWNDPSINYEAIPLLIEDSENIARTGRIITQNAVAFGCTSEGQATRMGKWKLWTAQNQTELVNFSTALPGAFLKPGDVINISDRKRTGINYSGRVSASTSNSLTLDRNVTFNSGSTYELSTLVTAPAAIYSGSPTITINGNNYSTGDRIPEAYVYSSGSYTLTTLDTEQKATNAFITAGSTNELQVVWKEHTYVQVNTITNPASSTNTISLASGTFGTTPSVSTIWALRETDSNNEVQDGSQELYKILSITQQEDNVYAISAVEHSNEKYEQIEKRYQVGTTPTSVFSEQEPEVIPPPQNLSLTAQTTGSEFGSAVTVSWDPPDDFGRVDYYEITHNTPVKVNGESPLKVSGTSFTFSELASGKYTFRVRLRSTKGNFSEEIVDTISLSQFDSEDDTTGDFPTIQGGMPMGVNSETNAFMSSDGNTFAFENANPVVASIASPFNSVTLTTHSVNVSNLSANTKAHIIFDYSAASIGLYEWTTTILPGLGFWRPIGSGNGGQTEFNSIGTCTITEGLTAVTGTLTTFTTSVAVGDIIVIKSTVPSTSSPAEYVAKVTEVTSDTLLKVDRRWAETLTNSTGWVPAYRPDLEKDAAVAVVTG